MGYEFTANQQRAIAHDGGNLQLIACAGSGKTEVLANRVARLLDPSGEPSLLPRNVVAFTFTEKAAGELKERIARRVDERYGPLVGMAELYVGTIHGFCLDLLQNEVPAFLKYGVLNEVHTAILEHAVLALEDNSDVRERIRERVRHVIVDEYQDVNPIQERLIRALHELGASICVVGDDDQTIYQWRGSDVGQILSFAERYDRVEQITLAENFRSSEAIVSVAREFIAQNQGRLPKAMETTHAQPFEKWDVCALPFDDDEQEAAWLVRTIAELRGLAFTDGDGGRRGLAYSDMAILLRSVKNNGPTITDALRAADVPFVISGMNKLFESPEAEAARQLF